MMDLEIRSELEKLKNHDPEIRENAYSKLITLFTNSQNDISKDKKTLYLKQLCSDQFLFYNIQDGVSDDSVARSFSLLGITLILSETRDLEIEWLIPHLLEYIKLESDFRGMDNQLGWIHCLAHLGDLLAFLTTNNHLSKKSLESIALALINKILEIKDFPLCYGEDHRLALGFFHALEDSLGLNDNILNSFSIGLLLEFPSKHNVVNILRCLYLELLENGKNKELLSIVKGMII